MKLRIEKISSRKIYTGRVLDFFADTVRINGIKTVREYADYPEAAGIIPVLPDGRILMVRQYRYANRLFSLEIPAGKKDKKETLGQCARRELAEETGYRAGSMKKLFSYYPAVSYSTEHLHIFLAGDLGLERSRRPDADEFLEVKAFSLDSILGMIKKNRIADSKTILSILYYARFR